MSLLNDLKAPSKPWIAENIARPVDSTQIPEMNKTTALQDYKVVLQHLCLKKSFGDASFCSHSNSFFLKK